MIAYLDDASQYILVIGKFEHSTAKNTIDVLKSGEKVAALFNGTIYAINTDRESQFYADKKGKKERVKWYNRRIHGALDLDIGETLEEAFIRKLRAVSLCGWKSD